MRKSVRACPSQSETDPPLQGLSIAVQIFHKRACNKRLRDVRKRIERRLLIGISSTTAARPGKLELDAIWKPHPLIPVCVYMCVHVCVHVCVCVCVCTCSPWNLSTWSAPTAVGTSVCVRTCMQVCECVFVRAHLERILSMWSAPTAIGTSVCERTCMHICVCVCVCVCASSP